MRPLILILSFLVVPLAFLPAGERPNVLVILTDDQGWGDIGYNNPGKVYTPNLDKLAAGGAKLTQHYVMPQCTPTRLALFTGRYQQRAGGLECAIGTGNNGRYDDAIRLCEAGQLGLPPAQAELQ